MRFLLADNLSLDLPEDRVPHRVTRKATRLVGEPKVIANSGGGSLTFVGEQVQHLVGEVLNVLAALRCHAFTIAEARALSKKKVLGQLAFYLSLASATSLTLPVTADAILEALILEVASMISALATDSTYTAL